MTSAPLEHTASIRGRTVAWGQVGEGPALVLVHGSPWSTAAWGDLIERLAQQFTVYVFDQPGHGLSASTSDVQTGVGAQAEVLVDLLTAWRLDRPHILAHGTGAAAALRARLLYDLRWSSLCMVSAQVLRPWASQFSEVVARHHDVFLDLPEHIHRGAVEAHVRSAVYRRLDGEALARLVLPWLGTTGQRAFYRLLAHVDERLTEEFEDRLHAINEPVHLVWGTDDQWAPLDHGYRLRDAMTGSTLQVVTGAGHLIQHDAPHRLQAELVRWLESVR